MKNTYIRNFSLQVGSDPKEARFWLRQFQHQAKDPECPFAVLQASSSILRNEQAVNIKGSYSLYKLHTICII